MEARYEELKAKMEAARKAYNDLMEANDFEATDETRAAKIERDEITAEYNAIAIEMEAARIGPHKYEMLNQRCSIL